MDAVTPRFFPEARRQRERLVPPVAAKAMPVLLAVSAKGRRPLDADAADAEAAAAATSRCRSPEIHSRAAVGGRHRWCRWVRA